MILFSAFLISTIVTILLMPIFINLACKMNLMDMPNDRKIHCDPIPRIGGVVMAVGAFASILIWAPMNAFVKALLIGSGILVTFGFVDDIKGIGFKSKFAGQILAALIVILYGGLKVKTLSVFTPVGFSFPDWFAVPLTMVVIVAVTNAINLSDGLDGLAGGISLLTFLCIGYLSYLDQFQEIEVISVAMIGAIFGLLRFNTHPATVFMGDAGSQLLGFIAITLSLALTRISTQTSIILTLLIMGIPIIDTLCVIVQRIINRRSPFVADKNHLHHKLMRLGLYHSESVLTIYLMHAAMVCLGFIFRFQSPWFLLALYVLYSTLIIATIFIADARGWKLKRYHFLDKIIKRQLKVLKEENAIIKFSFRAVEIGFIFLLLFSCFLPNHINLYFSLFSIALLGAILIAWQIKKAWASVLTEIAIFLMIPFLIYLSETDVVYLTDTVLEKAYTFSFGLLILFVLLTLKFTRRGGFKSTPMDFLILFVALVVPNLPDERIQTWQMGLVAAKIVVLFFTYEVLKGELRFDTKRLGVTGVMALMVISIRGFIG
jgi:UDP-GlcNAc:undecaprenyl-phosphate GlcNAc-1-phosphate transferase